MKTIRRWIARCAMVAAGTVCGVWLVLGTFTLLRPIDGDYRFINGVAAIRAMAWWLGPRFFVQRGDEWVGAHPTQAHPRFSVLKADNEFRAFVLGGSAALGDPYVHANFAFDSAEVATPELWENGGIAFWLKPHLSRVHPEKTVRVINAAMASQNLASVAGAYREILDIAEPDLVIVVSGNNEAFNRVLEHSELADELDRLTARFEATLAAIGKAATQSGVPTIVATVPVNLFDWIPDYPRHAELNSLLQNAQWQLAREWIDRRQGPAGIDPSWVALRRFVDGRMAMEAGNTSGAYGHLVGAKDADRMLYRTHSRWNDAIRRLANPGLSVIDLEARIREYAAQSIPGDDLFHDFCHLRLHGHALLALELARHYAQELGRDPIESAPILLPDTVYEQVRRLYQIKAAKWGSQQQDGHRDTRDLNVVRMAQSYARYGADLEGALDPLRPYATRRAESPGIDP